MHRRDILFSDHTLFRDREVFDFHHIPEQFHHRGAQITELADLARSGMEGASPGNAILRGMPGTGKTTTVLKLFDQIEESTRRIVPVYVNCHTDRTRFAVYAKIFEKFAGHSLSSSGTPLSELMKKVAQLVQDKDCALLVCLDDANYLLYEQELNGLLYTLLRLHETYGKVRIGVFAIVSDMSLDLRRAVDNRVFSVFHPDEVTFPPYGKSEMREILGERIRQGLYPNTMKKNALDLVVDLACEPGDVRVGIDLIRKAARTVEREGRPAVTRNDIVAVSRHVVSPLLQTRAEHLTTAEQEVLYHLARISTEGEVEMTAGMVFSALKEQMKISYTTFHERLKKFEKDGFINLHLRTGRGRTREIVLRYDPLQVMEACETN